MSKEKILKTELDKITDKVLSYGAPKKRDKKKVSPKIERQKATALQVDQQIV